ncbi:ATP-binding protein [Kitasatospora sp. NBC_00240]|uniref:ATP-binding protein n=1 Tax=Kitasatospora sp. NBC_00240 TaxID=2903567 RepID=UPI00225AA462|nr:ATP-binding protein [Kitasatospora sp. NBC_00240]MCX5215692.1 ATP-binding protein [Kitasatospora sp. NBC_00240]
MLTLRRAMAALLMAMAVMLGAAASPALADGGVQCPPLSPHCTVDAGGGGSGGGGAGGGGGGNGGGGGSAAKCFAGSKEVPCYRDGLGWFNSFNSCYYILMAPQPPADDPVWQGPIPVYAKAYQVTCPYSTSPTNNPNGVMVLSTPPPGYGGMVAPAVLAQRAIDSMLLKGADIGIAPKPGAKSLVGLPVWVWNNVSDTTWGPKGAEASAPGITVKATAHVSKIVWKFGDGTSQTCTGPGKAYDPSYGTQTPECGHPYTKAGSYTITATSTWAVDWTSTDGQSGQILTDRTSTTSTQIAEAQVLNTQ